jgi:EAL domain-containing protein (putative c-di-GMP-specific phosphodiesterase class I)/GGDEF domain-containing protein
MFGKAIDHGGQGQETIHPVIVDLAKRHGFDERKIEALFGAPLRHRQDFIVVEPLEGDHIDLDPKARCFSGRDAGQDPIEIAKACDVAEPFRIPRVQADIDPFDTRVAQACCMVREAARVRGQSEFIKTVPQQGADPRCDIDRAASGKRFAASQANAGDPACHEGLGQFGNLFEAEDLGARQERHVFGHAIAAAHVAAIGQRKAHIADAPAKPIIKRTLHHRHGAVLGLVCLAGKRIGELANGVRASNVPKMGGDQARSSGRRPVLIISDSADHLAQHVGSAGWSFERASPDETAISAYLDASAAFAIVDARSDFVSALCVVRALSDPVELNAGGLLGIIASADRARLPELIDAGITHALVEPFEGDDLVAALRLVDRMCQRLGRPPGRERRRSLQPFATIEEGDRDPLTGLAGASLARRWIDEHMAAGGCHVILIAVTRFEIINTAFGRESGDRLLQLIARLMTPLVHDIGGREALIARTTGAEFIIGLAGSVSTERLAILANQIAAAIDRPHPVGPHMISISTRIAALASGPDQTGATDVLRLASAVLAEMKTAQGVRVQLLSGENRDAQERQEVLGGELRGALDRNEIEIVFQPQVSVASGLIVGVEALARWQHPQHGTLGAATLFAVAEQSDYVAALSAHVQKRAVDSAAAWPATLHRLRLSVNVTADDMATPGFAERFLATVDESGFPRSRLTVELTETGLIADLAAASSLLSSLRAGGCRVAIDDFGTGYSSLAYLKALPLDYLKIDQRLSNDIAGSNRDRIVVRGVIDMARALGLAVVAEGVETTEQLALLAREGCNYYQGFLCSGAVDVQALVTLMDDEADSDL